MILEIDIGNSSLKWRLLAGDSGVVADRGVTGHADYPDFFSTLSAKPKVIRVASVVTALDSELREDCLRLWGVEPIFAKVTKLCAGVTNAYDDVGQMGVDRWLAMLAAYSDCRDACLVVDAGSALTVDIVKSSGQHLGGYIVPGLQLMRGALFRDTDRVKPSLIDYDGELLPGRSTQEAVAAGFRIMHLELILNSLKRLLLAAKGGHVAIYLTGGGALALRSALYSKLELNKLGSNELESGCLRSDECLNLLNSDCLSVRVAEDLVMDGLVLVDGAMPSEY